MNKITTGSITVDGKTYTADDIRKMLQTKETTGHWIPEMKEEYYLIDSDGDISTHFFGEEGIDKFIFSQGNCFKTHKEAEEHAEFLKAKGRVNMYIWENHPFTPNWDDDSRKYYVYYDIISREWEWGYCMGVMYSLLLPHMETAEACEDVIKTCEKDLKIVTEYLLTHN